jgi:hypothetical protein
MIDEMLLSELLMVWFGLEEVEEILLIVLVDELVSKGQP